MKGRQHEKVAKVLALIFSVLIIISLSIKIFILSWIVTFFGLTWFIAALFLFILGSILPDSDSEDMGSYIYFKGFLKFSAYLFKGLEYPITLITKRKIGHRESLHTIIGIAITSLALIILLSLIAKFFNLFDWKGAFLGFIFLFLGQFLHLICDIKEGWKISLK